MRRTALALLVLVLVVAAPVFGQSVTVKADRFVSSEGYVAAYGTIFKLGSTTAGDLLVASTGFGTYLKGTGSYGIYFQPTNGVTSWALLPSLVLGPATNWSADLGTDAVRVRTGYFSELNAWKLAARTVVASIGGEIWTAPTSTLSADVAAGDSTITVVDNFLVSGDRILLKGLTEIEWMAVTSSASGTAGAYVYSVTRNLDGTGANAWAKGAAVVDTGTTGKGLMTQYAETSALPSAIGSSALAGPTVLGVVRTGTTWSALAPRWAIGNLKGLYDYGTNNTYGYVAGDYTQAWLSADASHGVRGMFGNVTKFSIDNSGNAMFAGEVRAASGYFGSSSAGVGVDSSGLDIGTSGRIKGGATSCSSGTGIWFGYDGVYKFCVGNMAGQRVDWNGSNLNIYGANWELSESYGLHFNDASAVGDWSNLVSWGSGGQVGSSGSVTWLWSPGNGSNNYYVNAYDDQVNIGKGGAGDLLRVDTGYVTSFAPFWGDSSGHFEGALTAASYTDNTPWPADVDALAEIAKVRGDGTGGLDHATLPAFARATVTRRTVTQPQGPGLEQAKAQIVERTEAGRDLGAMISLLTVAVQQLSEQVADLRKQLDALASKK